MKVRYDLFAFVALSVCTVFYNLQIASNAEAQEMTGNQWMVLDDPRSSELERFAQWFHQDADLFFSSFDEGTAIYLGTLSAERKTMLRTQLDEFLEIHRDKSDSKVRKEWGALGAELWYPDLPLFQTLEAFKEQL